MTLTAMKKKSSERKRTSFPREVKYTTDFSDDWEKLERSCKHDMHLIKEAVSLIMMNDGPLSAEWKDHKLNGKFNDFRECHIKGDLLLVYQINQKAHCELAVFHRIWNTFGNLQLKQMHQKKLSY